jgi:hypothetical protein
MERQSCDPEVRVDLAELRTESEWRHQAVMGKLNAVHYALHQLQTSQSRRPLLSPEMVKALPYIAGVLLPVAVYLLTGSADKAMQASTIVPR